METATVVDMTPQAETLAEACLGQMMIAFGKGVGGLWVSRGTVRAIRQRYEELAYQYARDPKFVREYEEEAAHVLHKLETIGRVAALRATSDYRGTISAEDFIEAERRVSIKGPTQLCDGVF